MTQEQSIQKSRSAAYYKLLGLTPAASEAEIRQAYRQKSKLYHPDTTELPPEKAAEQFQQLKDAYTALTRADENRYDDHPVTMPQAIRRPSRVSTANLDPKQRPLSPGEVFALFLLGITFIGCLALALIVGTAQSQDLRTAQHRPPWAQPFVSWFHEQASPVPNPSQIRDLQLPASRRSAPKLSSGLQQ